MARSSRPVPEMRSRRRRPLAPSGPRSSIPAGWREICAEMVRRRALLLLGAALAGCGFQPRGHLALGEVVRSLYLEAPSALEYEIENALSGSGVARAASREAAEAVLVVASERFHRRTLSVDPASGREHEVELAYVVEFRVGRGGEDPARPSERVRLLRDYALDAAHINAKELEEDLIRGELRREAAFRILRRLDAALR